MPTQREHAFFHESPTLHGGEWQSIPVRENSRRESEARPTSADVAIPPSGRQSTPRAATCAATRGQRAGYRPGQLRRAHDLRACHWLHPLGPPRLSSPWSIFSPLRSPPLLLNPARASPPPGERQQNVDELRTVAAPRAASSCSFVGCQAKEVRERLGGEGREEGEPGEGREGGGKGG